MPAVVVAHNPGRPKKGARKSARKPRPKSGSKPRARRAPSLADVKRAVREAVGKAAMAAKRKRKKGGGSGKKRKSGAGKRRSTLRSSTTRRRSSTRRKSSSSTSRRPRRRRGRSNPGIASRLSEGAKVFGALAVGVGATIGVAKGLQKLPPMGKWATLGVLGGGAAVLGIGGVMLGMPTVGAITATPMLLAAAHVAMANDPQGVQVFNQFASQAVLPSPRIAGVAQARHLLPSGATRQHVPTRERDVAGVMGSRDLLSAKLAGAA